MPIKSASSVGIALASAQKLLASPTTRKLLGDATKAASDIGAQVVRDQLPGLVRRISSSAAGPRGAGPGASGPQPRSASGLLASTLAAAKPELASLRAQTRPLRQQVLADAELGLQEAVVAAVRLRSASAGTKVLGDKLATIGSQLQHDARPIATQLAGQATTRLAAAATRAFAKALATDTSAPTVPPEEPATPAASSTAPATEEPDAA